MRYFLEQFDFIFPLLLAALFIIVLIAYKIRISIQGQAHFNRVDQQGSSILLSKNLMEMVYWSLQPVAQFLIFLKFSPNMISWASLIFGILTGVSLASGNFGLGAFFSALSCLLDSLDGMVARLLHVSSDAGEVLDAVIDRYVEFLFLGSLMFYYQDYLSIQILALAALLGCFMVSYSSVKAESLLISPPKGIMRRPERAVYLTLGAALSPFSILWFEAPSSTPLAYPMILSMGLIASAANISAIQRFISIAKTIRIAEKKKNGIQENII